MENYELDSYVSGQGPVTRSWEQGNETLGSIKGREFLNYWSDYQLIKKDSAPWSYLVSYIIPYCQQITATTSLVTVVTATHHI
jgi:hypothetical protein